MFLLWLLSTGMCKLIWLCVLLSQSMVVLCILENEIFFELKSGGYRDGIKRKETR